MRLVLFSFVVVALSVQQAVSISIGKRATDYSDTSIAQFILNIEHLKFAYCKCGLQQFDKGAFYRAGYANTIRRHFEEMCILKKDHIARWTSVLADKAPKPCNYSFPFTDLRSFIVLSRVIKESGVAAYLSAIQLFSSKDYIVLSESILAIEARQATWVASFASNSVPWVGSFEALLSMRKVFSLPVVYPFITSCPPSNPPVGLTAFPPLNIDSAFPANQSAFPGDKVSVQPPPGATHIAFLTGGTSIFAPILNEKGTQMVIFPEKLSGLVYAIATTSGTDSSDKNTVAGTSILLFDTIDNYSLTN